MQPIDPLASRKRQTYLIGGLIVALSLWGIYLAVGATGWFTDANLFDLRRSVVVLVCSAIFVGFWLTLLGLARRRSPAAATPHLSVSGVASLLLAIVGFVIWEVARWWWDTNVASSVALGWLSALTFLLSAVAALISLSDPRPQQGKLMATLGLLLFFVALAIYGAQFLAGSSV